MTWVLWDIFVPLVLSFGLGSLFGWMAWGRQLAGRQTAAAEASVLATDTSADEQIAQSANFDEIESANIVLIQERDRAINELEDIRAQSDELQLKVDEMENNVQLNPAMTGIGNASIDDPIEVANLAVKSEQQSEQLVDLEYKLEQVTVACQEERKAKRELELELLNAKNQCEKLEALNISITDADSNETSKQLEADDRRADALRTEFEALEVNHAKLQAELEELKQTANSAQQNSAEKTREIEELKASIDTLRSSATEPSAIIERHQQEISEQNEQIEKLEKQIANTSLKLQEPAQLSSLQTGSMQPVPAVSVPVTRPEPVKSEPVKPGVDEVSTQKVKMVAEKKSAVKPTSSGYVPKSWFVPDTRPGKKERDKLTDIKGVGPVLEKLLHEAGIYYFRQIALLDKNGINELQQQIPQFPDRIRRDQWVKQAKKLHRVKYGETAKEPA